MPSSEGEGKEKKKSRLARAQIPSLKRCECLALEDCWEEGLN